MKQFYGEMWQRLERGRGMGGRDMDSRKNGQVYPRWVTITERRQERQERGLHMSACSPTCTDASGPRRKSATLAFYDALTSLPNRRLLLETAACGADRFGAPQLRCAAVPSRHGQVQGTQRYDGSHYGDLMLVEVSVRINPACARWTPWARLGWRTELS